MDFVEWLWERIMVPQQNMESTRSETPTSGLPLFGSQLVDKNSSTPYSDATQVGRWFLHPFLILC